uniref:lysoplasmalogenase n=2 Tax=Peptostreptococcaceae TaxID=186804 RepID=UPI0022E14D97
YFTYKPYKNYRGISKTITSILFVFIAISGYIENNTNFAYFIFILLGLIFSLFGDVFLIYAKESESTMSKNFIYGLLSFSFAHIFFSVGFISISDFSIYTIIFTLILSSISLLFLKSIKGLDFKGMFNYVAFYAIVISFMFAQSLNLYLSNSFSFDILIVTIGALLFVLSDLILAFDYFYKNSPKILGALNLLVYYSAQALIALSVFHVKKV